jgi:salicylate hydroxylase
MAIEDAAVLAKCLGDGVGGNVAGIPAALKHYARLRRSRVARVQRAARTAGRIYHLTGPAAYARDLVIRTMGARRMLARQDWIYDWRA